MIPFVVEQEELAFLPTANFFFIFEGDESPGAQRKFTGQRIDFSNLSSGEVHLFP